MKIVVFRHRPCGQMSINPRCPYMGFQLRGNKICHLFADGVNYCTDSCIAKRVMELTHVVRIYFDGQHIWIYAVYHHAVAKLLKELGLPYHVVDHRRAILTPMERRALALFSRARVSAVAKALGVTKSAASKLLKRAAAKASLTA